MSSNQQSDSSPTAQGETTDCISCHTPLCEFTLADRTKFRACLRRIYNDSTRETLRFKRRLLRNKIENDEDLERRELVLLEQIEALDKKVASSTALSIQMRKSYIETRDELDQFKVRFQSLKVERDEFAEEIRMLREEVNELREELRVIDEDNPDLGSSKQE